MLSRCVASAGGFALALQLASVAGLGLVTAGCGGTSDGAGSAVAAPSSLTDLSGSLAPVAAWFDEHAGRPRALLILSPV